MEPEISEAVLLHEPGPDHPIVFLTEYGSYVLQTDGTWSRMNQEKTIFYLGTGVVMSLLMKMLNR